MIKTTVYLPEDLEVRLDAEAAATGVSKAELIRRSIAMLLDASESPRVNPHCRSSIAGVHVTSTRCATISTARSRSGRPAGDHRR